MKKLLHKMQPRTLTSCPELLPDIMRKCAWVNHLFTTYLCEKLLEITWNCSKLWPRKLRKIGHFRKLPENSKMLETCSNPVRVSFWILADGVDTLFASFLFCFFVPTTAQPLRFGRANMSITGRWLCFFMPRGHLRKAVHNTCILSMLTFWVVLRSSERCW